MTWGTNKHSNTVVTPSLSICSCAETATGKKAEVMIHGDIYLVYNKSVNCIIDWATCGSDREVRSVSVLFRVAKARDILRELHTFLGDILLDSR